MPDPVCRRHVIALAAAGLAGCTRLVGDDGPGTATANPAMGEATQMGTLDLTSPAFDDGAPIPREYGRHERDVNPPLGIDGVPDDAAALVLVMDDPDAREPAGKVWLHWLVWNIDPERREIPEAWDGGDAVQGENDFGERGYGGPAPPDREHNYRFKLYAVDHPLDAPTSASEAAVGEAMADGIVARTQLEGTYAP